MTIYLVKKFLSEQAQKQAQLEISNYTQRYFNRVLGKGIDFTKVIIYDPAGSERTGPDWPHNICAKFTFKPKNPSK